MSFESNRLFVDRKNFPRGIRRSGEFTITEAKILETCGVIMQALFNNERQPQDALEASFLTQVQAGQATDNAYAKVWLKYLKISGPKKVHRLCDVIQSHPQKTSYLEDFDADETA